jgi:hypothetical protein
LDNIHRSRVSSVTSPVSILTTRIFQIGGLADQIVELVGIRERKIFYRRYQSTASQEEHESTGSTSDG